MHGRESWDYKESWGPKNWCFRTVALEKTLESPLDCKEIQPVHPKGDQSWVFIGRTDTEAETPILWPPDVKTQLTGKVPDTGKDWKQEEKGTRGWGGWKASPTQQTWVWVNSRSWWWTARPGVLQSRGSQRVGHAWVTELIWTGRVERALLWMSRHHYSSHHKKVQVFKGYVPKKKKRMKTRYIPTINDDNSFRKKGKLSQKIMQEVKAMNKKWKQWTKSESNKLMQIWKNLTTKTITFVESKKDKTKTLDSSIM